MGQVNGGKSTEDRQHNSNTHSCLLPRTYLGPPMKLNIDQ